MGRLHLFRVMWTCSSLAPHVSTTRISTTRSKALTTMGSLVGHSVV